MLRFSPKINLKSFRDIFVFNSRLLILGVGSFGGTESAILCLRNNTRFFVRKFVIRK